MGHKVLKELAALSKMLQKTMLDARAFEMAVKEGYIEVADDGKHLRWMLGNKTLLAYFCGKLWCGDKGFRSRRNGGMTWLTGKGAFPGAELNRLFECSVLKQTRNNRRNLKLPEHYELVDALFDSLME